MPTQLFITAISEYCCKLSNKQTYFIGIFYPSGEPISQQRYLYSMGGVGWPFAVVHYSFMSYFLAVAAILARE